MTFCSEHIKAFEKYINIKTCKCGFEALYLYFNMES